MSWVENFDTGSYDPAWTLYNPNPTMRPTKVKAAPYKTSRVTLEDRYYDGWDIYDTSSVKSVVVESQKVANEAAAGFTLDNLQVPYDGSVYVANGWLNGTSSALMMPILAPIKVSGAFYKYAVSSTTFIKYTLYKNGVLVLTNDLIFNTTSSGYVIVSSAGIYLGSDFNGLLASDVFKIKFWMQTGTNAATYLSKIYILGLQLYDGGSYGSNDCWWDDPGSLTVDNTQSNSGAYSLKVVGNKQSYLGNTTAIYRPVPNPSADPGDFYYKQSVYLPNPTEENYDPTGWRPGVAFSTYGGPYLFAKRNVHYVPAATGVSGGASRTNSASIKILKAEPDTSTRYGEYLTCTSDYADAAAMATAQGTSWDFYAEYQKLSLAPTATTYDFKVMVKAAVGHAFKLSARNLLDAPSGTVYGSIVTVNYTGTGNWDTVTIPNVPFSFNVRNFNQYSTGVQFCAWQVSGTLNPISIDEMWVESPYSYGDGWWWGRVDTSYQFFGVTVLPNQWQCLNYKHSKSPAYTMELSTASETTGPFSKNVGGFGSVRVYGDYPATYWIDTITVGATDELLTCAPDFVGIRKRFPL